MHSAWYSVSNWLWLDVYACSYRCCNVWSHCYQDVPTFAFLSVSKYNTSENLLKLVWIEFIEAFKIQKTANLLYLLLNKICWLIIVLLVVWVFLAWTFSTWTEVNWIIDNQESQIFQFHWIICNFALNLYMC